MGIQPGLIGWFVIPEFQFDFAQCPVCIAGIMVQIDRPQDGCAGFREMFPIRGT